MIAILMMWAGAFMVGTALGMSYWPKQRRKADVEAALALIGIILIMLSATWQFIVLAVEDWGWHR